MSPNDLIRVVFRHNPSEDESDVYVEQGIDNMVVVQSVDQLDRLVSDLVATRPFLAKKIVTAAIANPYRLMDGVCGLALDDEEEDR